MVAPTRADAGRAFPNLIVQRPEKISHQLESCSLCKTPAWILQCAGSHPCRRPNHAARHARGRSICIQPMESERNGGTLGVPDATTPPMRAGRRVIHATVACRYRNGDGQCQLCSFLYLVPNRRQHSPRTRWPAGSFRHRTRWQKGVATTANAAPLGLTAAGAARSLAPVGLLAASVTAPAGRKGSPPHANVAPLGGPLLPVQHGPRTLWPAGSFRHRTRWQGGGRPDWRVVAVAAQSSHPLDCWKFRHRTRWQEAGRPDWRVARSAARSSHPLACWQASSPHPLAGSWPPRLAGCCGQQHGPHTPWPVGSFRHRTRWQQAGRHDMQLPHPRAGSCRPAARSSHPLACWQLPSPPAGSKLAVTTCNCRTPGRVAARQQHGPRTPWPAGSFRHHPLAASWPSRHATAAPPGGSLPASSTVLAPLGLLAASVTAPAGSKLAATTCNCRTPGRVLTS